jgi:hypothetical protein
MFDLDARTRVGRNLTIGLAEVITYLPSFSLLSLVVSDIPLSRAVGDVTPTGGLFMKRTLHAGTNLEADYRWGRRDSTLLSYTYRMAQLTGDNAGSGPAHDIRTVHRRSVVTGLKIRADHRYISASHRASQGDRLFRREHKFECGPEIEKTLSRSRHLALSLAAGAGHLESFGGSGRKPFRTWVPMGSGTLNLSLSSLWLLQGGYRRDFSLLRGVTDSVYTTDTAHMAAGGRLTPATSLSLEASYRHSVTPRASGDHDTFIVYGGSLQVGLALNDKVSATVGYHYYHHWFSDPSSLVDPLPARYDRHAVRVGLTLRLPLAGTEHGWGLGTRRR